MTVHGAVLTPPGVAAIATVRLTGPGSVAVLEALWRGSHADFAAERLVYGHIGDGQDTIDNVVAVADGSGTQVDISCHGGPRVIERLLGALRQHGVEIVPWQALVDADSIAGEVALNLPDAKTRLGALAVAAQHPGGLTAWAVRTRAALAEHTMSFAALREEVRPLLGTFKAGRRLLEPPTVVLAGPVNAGKSSLANSLAGRAQSIAADLPGTTRDYTEQLVDMQGLPVRLVDVAGGRGSQDALEQAAYRQAQAQWRRADLILLVVEADGQEAEQIEEMLDELEPTADVLAVVNKADLLDELPAGRERLYVSALTGLNLEQLHQSVAGRFGLSGLDPTQPLVFTERQVEWLTEARVVADLATILSCLDRLIGREA